MIHPTTEASDSHHPHVPRSIFSNRIQSRPKDRLAAGSYQRTAEAFTTSPKLIEHGSTTIASNNYLFSTTFVISHPTQLYPHTYGSNHANRSTTYPCNTKMAAKTVEASLLKALKQYTTCDVSYLLPACLPIYLAYSLSRSVHQYTPHRPIEYIRHIHTNQPITPPDRRRPSKTQHAPRQLPLRLAHVLTHLPLRPHQDLRPSTHSPHGARLRHHLTKTINTLRRHDHEG